MSLGKNIIGHSSLIGQMEKMLRGNRIPHGFLFSGPESVGKYTLARSLAESLLETDNLQNHPDFHSVSALEGKKDISVESIRELCTKLRLKPFAGKKVVAIINDAEKLSLSAANALLMTLEEPSDSSHLILVTKAENKLPETIISRTQKFLFGFLAEAELSELLENLSDKGLSKKAAKFLSEICQGSLASFKLTEFLDPNTYTVNDPSGLIEYLEEYSVYQQKLYSSLSELFENDCAYALALAAKFGNAKDSRFWPSLRKIIREKLADKTTSDFHKFSVLYDNALETEQLIDERNLNPTLKLSQLFIKFPQN